MNEIVVVQPDDGELRRDCAPLIERARALVVADKATHREAQHFLIQVAVVERRVKELFAPAKKAAAAVPKALCAAERKLLDPLGEARSMVGCKCLEYEREEKRKADELACQLAEQARRQEEERLLADAVAAEAAGDRATADAILSEPVSAPIVQVETETVRVKGVSIATTWRAEVTDLPKLVAYVAAHAEWSHLLTPNQVALNGLARSQRGALAIPGVRAIEVVGHRVSGGVA